jgi:ferredoxin-thioredoxin reductase catalytic subunit
MNKEELRAAWDKFTENNDFMLNPDEAHVSSVIDGVLANEEGCGLKLCPCRLRDGTRKCDLGLLCPCYFKSQDVWRAEGRCWCGLFVQRPPSNA